MAVCTTTLPVVSQEFCDPEINFGQIEQFFFTRQGDGLTDVTDDAEWTGRLNNSTALPSPPTLAKIRALDVIGSMPEPEATEVTISRNRVVRSAAKFTLTLTVDHTDQTNYDFAQDMLNKTQTYSVWFLADGLIFGGNSGLTAQVTVTGYTIPEARTDIQGIKIVVKWTGDLPDRAVWPF